jgi:hypothetical protein
VCSIQCRIHLLPRTDGISVRVWLTRVADHEHHISGARNGYLDHVLFEEALAELRAVLVGSVDDGNARSDVLVVAVAYDARVMVSAKSRVTFGSETLVGC